MKQPMDCEPVDLEHYGEIYNTAVIYHGNPFYSRTPEASKSRNGTLSSQVPTTIDKYDNGLQQLIYPSSEFDQLLDQSEMRGFSR